MADPQSQQQGQPEAQVGELNEFQSLLNKSFKPKTDQAKTAIESAVTTLAQQALSNTALVSDDILRTVADMIAAIDRKLSEQVNLILHHEDFQKLEGAWRGLHHLVSRTETDTMLKIRVMNISKADLSKT